MCSIEIIKLSKGINFHQIFKTKTISKVKEESYLKFFVTPSDLGPNLKEIILAKLKENYANKEIQRRMIIKIELKNLNIPYHNRL